MATHNRGSNILVNEQVVVLTAARAILAEESGTTFLIGAANLALTLPPTAAGLRYRFALAAAGLSAGAGYTIDPVAADAIHGGGLTSVDGEALRLPGATDREGDSVVLVGDGVDGWYIFGASGTYDKV